MKDKNYALCWRVTAVLALLLCSAVAPVAHAQRAAVRGVVTDEVTGELIPFASVVVQGKSAGTSTDFDGAFELGDLEPGVVNLSFSSVRLSNGQSPRGGIDPGSCGLSHGLT